MAGFTINGSAASLAPYSQEWEDLVLGTAHDQSQILSGYKHCVLTFDSCPSALYQQWSQFVSTGTSVVSVTILNLDQTSFVSFSGVSLSWERRPRLEQGLLMGPWSIRIVGIQP